MAALQRYAATRKPSTGQLYAVRVTPGRQVYALKAPAQATGRSAGDRPQYRFALYVNSPPRTLEAIGSVEYRFDHPPFDRKQLVSDDAGNQYWVGYVGWGCLNRVGVAVTIEDGSAHGFDVRTGRNLGTDEGSRHT